MSKTTSKNMSLAIDANLQEHLKREAQKRGVTTSKLVRDLILKFLPENEGVPDYNTVILKIPKSLTDKAALETWLDVRCGQIANSLCQ